MKTIGELIGFFEAIPEERWTINVLEDRRGARRCALGHLNAHITGDPFNWEGSRSILGPLGIDLDDLAFANNGKEDQIFYMSPFTEEKLEEMGKTPKARVMSYLRSLENQEHE